MRSVLIWLISTIMGALAGYGLSFLLTEINMFIQVAGGVIIGSSVAITINIHRERAISSPNPEPGTEMEEPE